MTNSNGLLNQLCILTEIRDLEQVEVSLLEALHHSFRPLGLVLLKLDATGCPMMKIAYAEQGCEVGREGIEVSDAVAGAIEHLKQTEARETVVRDNEELHAVHALFSTNSGRTFLIITSAAALPGPDGQLVAGMIQICRNYYCLLLDAQTDQLTGLANRKTFDECVNKIHNLLAPDEVTFPDDKRATVPSNYWLAMVDIDHFKAINDRFGHLYGDEVLVLLAQMLRSAFREDDLIFRFGGEEFVLMIRCPDQETSRYALDRLRRNIEGHLFPQVDGITISIGATRFTREIFAVTLLDYADQALYFSKKNGRNRVTFFEDMLKQGFVSEERFLAGPVELF